MKTKTGLLALGLFTVAGVLTVSCGGSSDSTDSTATAGTTSTTAGTTGTTGGNASSAGTSNNGAGTANNNGGTATNNGGTATNTAGTATNQGGANDNPGAGGAGAVAMCPSGTADGEACTRMNGQNGGCQLNATTYCSCQGRNNSMWNCIDLSDLGAGGAGNGFQAECGDAPMNGDDCRGFGSCGTGNCVCFGGTVLGC